VLLACEAEAQVTLGGDSTRRRVQRVFHEHLNRRTTFIGSGCCGRQFLLTASRSPRRTITVKGVERSPHVRDMVRGVRCGRPTADKFSGPRSTPSGHTKSLRRPIGIGPKRP
jgi:hypothetical protein